MPGTGRGRRVGGAAAGVGGAAGSGRAGAGARHGGGLISSRMPEVVGVCAAARPPAGRASAGCAARRRWAGGAGERGEYPSARPGPPAAPTAPARARLGGCESVRVGSPPWGCLTDKPSEVLSGVRKSHGFSEQFEFSFENVTARDVDLLVYLHHFFFAKYPSRPPLSTCPAAGSSGRCPRGGNGARRPRRPAAGICRVLWKRHGS